MAIWAVHMGSSSMSSMQSSIESTFYCHSCADDRGLLSGLHLVGQVPTTYQVDKARKHAGPASTSTTELNSVLNSGSTGDLDRLAANALARGFIEIEPNGVRTLVYQSRGQIGTQFDARTPSLSLDCFRWVLSTDARQAHGYPVSSTQYGGVKCVGCGHPVTFSFWREP